MIDFNLFPAIKPNCEQQFSITIVGGTRFLQIKGFPFQDLAYFPPLLSHDLEDFDYEGMRKKPNHDSNQYIYEMGKEKFMNVPLCFDLQFMQYIDIAEVDVILVSDFTELFFLPYILKSQKFGGKVFAARPLVTLGDLYVQEFVSLVQKRNKQYQIQFNYYKENQAYEWFEENHNMNMQEWVEIFSLKEWKEAKEMIIQLSFGEFTSMKLQNIDQTIQFQPLASGVHIGASFWKFKIGEAFTFALVDQISLQQQRHCLAFEDASLQGLDVCILGTSDNKIPTKTQNFQQFIDITKSKLKEGKNVVIPFLDHTLYLDLQSVLINEFYESLQIFVISQEGLSFLKLANSEVSFLNKGLQQNIFKEGSVNPFCNLLKLADEKMQFSGDLDTLVHNKAMTIENLLYSVTPAIYFVYDPTFRIGETGKLIQKLQSMLQGSKISSSQQQFSVINTNPKFAGFERIFSSHIYNKLDYIYLPIDYSEPMNVKVKLLEKLGCKQIYVPKGYYQKDLGQNKYIYPLSESNTIICNKIQVDCPQPIIPQVKMFTSYEISSVSIVDDIVKANPHPIPEFLLVDSEKIAKPIDVVAKQLYNRFSRSSRFHIDEQTNTINFYQIGMSITFSQNRIQVYTQQPGIEDYIKELKDYLSEDVNGMQVE